MEPYWGETNGHAPHSVKYESEAAVSSFPYCTESSLNFSTSATTYSEDDAEYATGRRNKTSRQDPLSHRIIEKRRRDRMNSCLADLSRLIPPQYQRKGRGRIEKTEIIEMAIRHLKHLKNECNQKENDYRLGYTDCMKEVAKFLYDSQMQEFCYRLLARLQEHCDEIMKTDCYKSRNCHGGPPDNVSASSGSPHQMFHPAQPLCQLREMIASSDIEHSNDHNDVKDLSFRNHLNQLQRQHNGNHLGTVAAATSTNSTAIGHTASTPNLNGHSNGPLASADSRTSAIVSNSGTSSGSSPPSAVAAANNPSSTSTSTPSVIAAASSLAQQPHQAPVITSTGPSSLLMHQHHTDSSNHDFESSREPILHTDTSNMHSPPPRDSLLNHHSHHAHLHHHSLSQHSHLSHHHNHDSSMSVSMTLSERMRNYSESSHDVEHNNNYKYKNHIKERFNHELHDEETSSEHCHPAPGHLHVEDHSHTHSMSEHSKDGTEPEIAPIIAKKRKLAEAAAAAAAAGKALDDCDTLSIPAVSSARITPLSPSTGELMMASREEKPFTFGDIKTELNGSSGSSSAASVGRVGMTSNTSVLGGSSASMPTNRSFSVPIFALHGQGTYYIPLNIDYNALVPFLNGIDLLEKNYASAMPVVHPININVNFMPATPSASFLAAAAAAVAVAAGKQQLQPQSAGAVNGGAVEQTVAAIAKGKLKNGW